MPTIHPSRLATRCRGPQPVRGPAEPVGAGLPLLLNTGRVRDQWHTMTRTGRVPRLLSHVEAPSAALAPSDAARLGLEDGGLVRLTSAEGSLVLQVAVSAAQRPSELFVPMHWTDQYASKARVDTLVPAEAPTVDLDDVKNERVLLWAPGGDETFVERDGTTYRSTASSDTAFTEAGSALPDCTTATLVPDAALPAYLWADATHLGPNGHAQLAGLAIDRARRNPF